MRRLFVVYFLGTEPSGDKKTDEAPEGDFEVDVCTNGLREFQCGGKRGGRECGASNYIYIMNTKVYTVSNSRN
jgi:hypothetical protein